MIKLVKISTLTVKDIIQIRVVLNALTSIITHQLLRIVSQMMKNIYKTVIAYYTLNLIKILVLNVNHHIH